jgi:hypothetical protein
MVFPSSCGTEKRFGVEHTCRCGRRPLLDVHVGVVAHTVAAAADGLHSFGLVVSRPTVLRHTACVCSRRADS